MILTQVSDVLQQMVESKGECGVYNCPEHDMDSCLPLEFHVGDETFLRLIEELRVKDQNRYQDKKEEYSRDLARYEADTTLEVHKRDKELRRFRKLLRITEAVKEVHYPNRIINQTAYLRPDLQPEIRPTYNRRDVVKGWAERLAAGIRPELTNLMGLPLKLADSHKHAYDFIRDYLIQADEKVTIVRLDAHTDDSEKELETLSNANYVARLLIDPETKDMISSVITVCGYNPFDSKIPKSLPPTNTVKGVTHFLLDIFSLPEIGTPVLLDIDMDAHEIPLERPRPGGYCMGRESGSYALEDNQKMILLHPEVSSKILRERIKDPREIYISLERGFRNNIFHFKIEHDFFAGLIDD